VFPDGMRRNFPELYERFIAIRGLLERHIQECASAAIHSPRARFQQQLDTIEEQFELEFSSDPQDPRDLLGRLLSETETFLVEVAPVINRATQGSRWKKNLFRDGMRIHFPDLYARVVAIRGRLETRLQELIPPRLEDLCARYEHDLDAIKESFEQQKSRARLEDLRTLRTTLGATTDGFLKDLATTVGFRTEGHGWSIQVLQKGEKHFPDPQRVRQLIQRSKSIGEELEDRITDLLYAYADSLCTTFQGRLATWRDQLQNQQSDLEGLETLSTEVSAVTEEFLKSVAALIEYSAEGDHWRNNLISRGLQQHLSHSAKTIADPPSRRVRSLYDEARALEKQIAHSIRQKKKAGLNSEENRNTNAGQAPLAEVAHSARARSASVSKAPAARGDKPRDALLQSNQLQQSTRPTSVSKPADEWNRLEAQLDICDEVISNIQTDLHSPGQLSPRMLKGADSQTVSYRDIVQWIIVKLNRTKDSFKAAEANYWKSQENDSAGLKETRKKISQVEESLMALIPKVLALRHTAPTCSQRTMGAFIWAEIESRRLKQKEDQRTTRRAVRRQL
jgi:hypothetical protein